MSPDGGSTPMSAGTIQITSTAMPVTLPFQTGQYVPFVAMPAIWSKGETLTVTAAGDQIPAFRTQVLAPHPITLVAPTLVNTPQGAQLTIPLGKDLVFTWTGGIAGFVEFDYNQTIGAPFTTFR